MRISHVSKDLLVAGPVSILSEFHTDDTAEVENPMFEDPRISEFLDKAQAAGIPHQSLVGLLTARGWREKDVYTALGEHYRKIVGVEIPSRIGSGASAKDAFFYLLIFSTLATWTISFGTLAFQLIDRWLSDPLFSSMAQQQYATYQITWSLSAILIAFPLYLLITRTVLREAAADPAKLDSGIRKWLTYMALVVAASIFMGDLITALAFLLRGEVTSRFLAKAFVVLTLSGGVFFYYFGGLRRTDAASQGPSSDRLMAAVSTAVVILMIVLGFSHLGPPSAQRELRADTRRLSDLYRMSTGISIYWRQNAQKLPSNTSQIPGGAPTDPITHVPYEYLPGTGDTYNLCAIFTHESPVAEPGINLWAHPAGRHCFPLNATVSPQYPTEPIQ